MTNFGSKFGSNRILSIAQKYKIVYNSNGWSRSSAG